MAGHILKLDDLSCDDLTNLLNGVDDNLCAIFKVDDRRLSINFENKIASTVSSAWKSAVNRSVIPAIDTLLSGKFTQTRIRKFLKSIGIGLKTILSKVQIDVLRSRLRSIWDICKKAAAKEAKWKVSFSAIDTRAVAAINQKQVFWVNNFYDKHLAARIQAVSEDVLLRQGLSQKEAARELRSALARDFGLKPGGPSGFGLEIPAQYAGNPDLYFRGLVSTTSHQSRTFGRVTAFDEAGVITYELVNPMDERTGQICFAPGAMVLMADHTQQDIAEITPGMLVVTGQGKIRKVKAVSKRYGHEWIPFKTYAGKFLITLEHEMLTSDGWKRAKDVTENALVRMCQLRQNVYEPQKIRGQSPQIPNSTLLQLAVLPRKTKASVLDDENLRALREEVQSQSNGSLGGEEAELLPRMQQSSQAERDPRICAMAVLSSLREVFQVKTCGVLDRQKSDLLFEGLSISCDAGESLRNVREVIQAIIPQNPVLLSRVLSQKSESDNTRISDTSCFDGIGTPFPRRSKSRQGINRFPNNEQDRVRDKRGILAQGRVSQTKREQTTSDSSKWLDTCLCFGVRSNETPSASYNSRDYFCPVWDQSDQAITESNLKFGWAHLERSEILNITLPAYNLEIEGDDPTYIVAGSVVHNCLEMNGQVFSVEVGVEQMNKILGAKDPDEVKEIAPWNSGSELQKILEGTTRGSTEAARALEKAGAILPPFHPLCIFFNSQVITATGVKAVQDIKVGDLVLTHRGRYREVIGTASKKFNGYSINIVAQVTALSVTSDHPILGVDLNDETIFIPACKLCTNQRIVTHKKTLRALQENDVPSCFAACDRDTFGTTIITRLESSLVENITVYDLSVEEDESFVANGIVVHNCRTDPVIVS